MSGRSAITWELELGKGEQPESWQRIAAGATGIRSATANRGQTPIRRATASRRLASVDPRGLEAGGWTLRLRVTDGDGNLGEDRTFFEVQRDRSLARAFPRRLGTSGEAAPALADLDGDRAAEIVLACSDGAVRVFSVRRGRLRRRWTRLMGRTPGSRPSEARIGPVRSGFAGTPAIGDIAGSRRPDIVVGAADQHIYAVNGRGRALPGWPVLARDGEGGDKAKILSSPAIGDLDGDRSPDVVEGTAEVYGSPPSTTGRVHAFSAQGKPLPGWPVRVPALAADAIPLAGEGVPASPVLADVDGDGRDEVAAAAFTGRPELFRGDGTRLGRSGSDSHFQSSGRGSASRASAPGMLALGANAAFGRTSAGGPLRFFGGGVDERLAAAQASPATRLPFEHLLGGWDAASGDWLSGFPSPVEGWTILAGPVLADVDADGSAEVLAGSSGNVLHALREGGGEPDGWPKSAAGWLLAAPAVGDVDGDRRSEVVAVTRDGWLFAWNTPARVPKAPEWPSFRHDPHNSGNHGG